MARLFKRHGPASFAIHVLLAAPLLLILTLGEAALAWSEVSEADLVTVPVSFYQESNLLAARNGATVFRVPSNTSGGESLIDGSPRRGWQSAEQFKIGQPLDILFQLPTIKEVGNLFIQPQSSQPGTSMPQEMEILVTTKNEPNDFVSLGRYRLHQEGAWQSLHLPSQKTAFLKIRIHSIYGSGLVGIGEVAAFAPGVDPVAPKYVFEATSLPPVVEEKSSSKESQMIGSLKPTAVDQPFKNRNTLSDFQHVMKVKRDDDVTVVIGSVTTKKDLETIKGLFAGEPSVEFHVSINPSDNIHPRTIRIQTASSMKASGLDGIQVRSRKEGELILLGNVASKSEEELALSIADVQPGIDTVVNLLKISK